MALRVFMRVDPSRKIQCSAALEILLKESASNGMRWWPNSTYTLSHDPSTIVSSFSKYRQSTTRNSVLGLLYSFFADSIIAGDASMPNTDCTAGRKFSVNLPSPQPTSRTLSVGWGTRYRKRVWVSLGTKEAEAEYA